MGAVFLVATLPNLLFGPIAGTLVDRWDHREVMIVSDLLRAGLVLLIPLAAVTNLVLAYPLVFLVTTVSIFFRPAKGAILPRLVAEEDLVAANSALWVGETFADIGGYVIAGLFVALLGSQLPLAFWVDSVTYVASALLIASIAVKPAMRASGVMADTVGAAMAGVAGRAGRLRARSRPFAEELLRGLAVPPPRPRAAREHAPGDGRPVHARDLPRADTGLRGGVTRPTARSPTSRPTRSSRARSGLGNLVGGFVIGLIGTPAGARADGDPRLRVTGALVALLAVAGNLALALGDLFGAGVGNLVFVIPSQTLFQRRTPPELMGRVLGLRFSLVFGAMTLAMGLGGVLGAMVRRGARCIGVFGLVTVAAGLAGLLVPAVRDA